MPASSFEKAVMRAILPALLFAAMSVAAAQSSPSYTVKTLGQLAIHPQSLAPAQVVPDNESRIAAEVGARIDAIPARVGQAVRKGEVLVQLDARQSRLAVEHAASQVELIGNRLRLAQLQLEQARSLHESKFVSPQLLEQRRTEAAVIDSELKIARTAHQQAKLALDKTTIRAPFAGTVRERLAGEGEMAVPGQPLLTLVEQARNEVRARIPVHQVADLQAARAIAFRQGGEAHPVRLVRLSGVVDPRAQTREAVLRAERPLLSGVAGELAWASTRAYLPAAYVQQRGKQFGVWVEEGGKPVFRPVPAAQAGRPVALDWPAETRIVDGGRFALGAPAASAASAPAAPR